VCLAERKDHRTVRTLQGNASSGGGDKP